MPVFERGEVSIYYEEHGSASGFPVMLLSLGGLDSTIERWKRGAFAPIESFSEYRVVILDQRNAGRSSGPLDFDDPWGGYADDQLGLADHLGLDRFHVVGQCIGCSYALLLARRAPERIASAVLAQPIGASGPNHAEWLTDFLTSHFFRDQSEEQMRMRPELDLATLERFARRIFGGEFVFSVSRDDVRSCTTPLLVLPGIDAVHPGPIGREVARLAPNAEMMDPWKTPELIPKAIERVQRFLEVHTPK